MNLPGRANVNVPLDVPVFAAPVDSTPLAPCALLGARTSCCTNVPRAECTCATNAFSCSVPLANACDATSIDAPIATLADATHDVRASWPKRLD